MKEDQFLILVCNVYFSHLNNKHVLHLVICTLKTVGFFPFYSPRERPVCIKTHTVHMVVEYQFMYQRFGNVSLYNSLVVQCTKTVLKTSIATYSKPVTVHVIKPKPTHQATVKRNVRRVRKMLKLRRRKACSNSFHVITLMISYLALMLDGERQDKPNISPSFMYPAPVLMLSVIPL